MHGLSEREDLSFLNGAELLQVCVGRNELILNFHNGARVTIFGEFRLRTPAEPEQHFDDPVVGAPAICALLHQTVVAACSTKDGGLDLRFTSEHVVTIVDSYSQYESFLIEGLGRRIVV